MCGVWFVVLGPEEIWRYWLSEMHETLSTDERANGLPLPAAVALTAWAGFFGRSAPRSRLTTSFGDQHNYIIYINRCAEVIHQELKAE